MGKLWLLIILGVAGSAITGGGGGGTPAIPDAAPGVQMPPRFFYWARSGSGSVQDYEPDWREAGSDGNCFDFASATQGTAWLEGIAATIWRTSTVNGNTTYIRNTNSQMRVSASYPNYVSALHTIAAATAAERFWPIVWTEGTTTPGDTYSTEYCGIRYSTSASDTEWKCCSGDGTNNSCEALGARVTGNYTFAVSVASGNCTCSVYTYSTGAVLYNVVKTSHVATSTSDLYYWALMTTLDTTAKSMTLAWMGRGR